MHKQLELEEVVEEAVEEAVEEKARCSSSGLERIRGAESFCGFFVGSDGVGPLGSAGLATYLQW